MYSSELCKANKAIGLEVRNFIVNVPGVKEESITDYLVWKWRLLDARFKYIKTKTFTRQEESSSTGADFELELWIVGRTKCLPFLFQAKKFIKPFDSYITKLNYPNNTQAQLRMLLSYAASKSLLPFYAIYTNIATPRPMCSMREDLRTGVYMIHANTINEFANRVHGRKVSLSSLIGRGNPLHCMFCCLMGSMEAYYCHYFNSGSAGKFIRPRDALPSYVTQVLNMPTNLDNADGSIGTRIDGELPSVRCIGVYDLGYDNG